MIVHILRLHITNKREGLYVINIDYKSRTPIYEQIIQNIKFLVITGYYKADEQIPSVRQLTSQLGVNPNTIQKAYSELERQGVIYSLSGRGNFISSDTEKLVNSKKIEILGELENVLNEAKNHNVSYDDVDNAVKKVYSEVNSK